jgi:putative tryptophan/tyrosine transport system substrate-binding protein
VRSLNRPGANVTGVTSMAEELTAKRFGLLHELVPGADRFAVLINPNTEAVGGPFVNEVQAAVKAIGREAELFSISSSRDLSSACIRLQRLRLACRSGAQLILILATRYGWARPGHACLWTDILNPL